MGSVQKGSRGAPVRQTHTFYNTPTPQTLVIGAAQVLSSAIEANEVLFQTDESCFFLVDTIANLTGTPVTVATGHFMPAGVAWPITIEPGYAVGVITSGAAGNFYISAIK